MVGGASRVGEAAGIDPGMPVLITGPTLPGSGAVFIEIRPNSVWVFILLCCFSMFQTNVIQQ